MCLYEGGEAWATLVATPAEDDDDALQIVAGEAACGMYRGICGCDARHAPVLLCAATHLLCLPASVEAVLRICDCVFALLVS